MFSEHLVPALHLRTRLLFQDIHPQLPITNIRRPEPEILSTLCASFKDVLVLIFYITTKTPSLVSISIRILETMYLGFLVIVTAAAVSANPLSALSRANNTTTITTTSNLDTWNASPSSLPATMHDLAPSEAGTASTSHQPTTRDDSDSDSDLIASETNALMALIIVALVLEIALLVSNIPSILEWWTNERIRRRRRADRRNAERQRAADLLNSHPPPRDGENHTVELSVLHARSAGQWPLNNNHHSTSNVTVGSANGNENGSGGGGGAQTQVQTQVQDQDQQHRPHTPQSAGHPLRDRETHRSMNFSRVSRPPTAHSAASAASGVSVSGNGQDTTEAPKTRPSVGPDDLQSLLSAARMPEPEHETGSHRTEASSLASAEMRGYQSKQEGEAENPVYGDGVRRSGAGTGSNHYGSVSVKDWAYHGL